MKKSSAIFVSAIALGSGMCVPLKQFCVCLSSSLLTQDRCVSGRCNSRVTGLRREASGNAGCASRLHREQGDENKHR